MGKFLTILLTFGLLGVQAKAQEVGIDFAQMPVGTTLVTEEIATPPFRLAETYKGQQDGFYVTEIIRTDAKGESKLSSTSYYDAKGRLVRRDRQRGFEAYTPYSCHYVTGECIHNYEYPNPFKNFAQTKNVARFSNRLEGNTLILSWQLVDGTLAEVPFELGPYNLRVSSSYRNRLGQDRGHRFIELIEPGAAEGSATAPQVPQNAQTATEGDGGAQDRCTALYQTLRSEAPGDISKCTPVIPAARTEQCTLPSSDISERKPSRVIMILDASGSMAGQVGGSQKMAAAKQEAESFLAELADDVPVGLVVYGHRGNNRDDGKAESCAGVEWALPIGSRKGDIAASIRQLNPTGWTPMGGALDFVGREIAALAGTDDPDAPPPVVYLISDGEETCGGDPVSSARALHASGSKTLVNVIGFDVDPDTRAQLEGISQAGGGRYFAAADAADLARHLRSAADAVNSQARFEQCLNLNQGYAETVYNSARNTVPGCFVRESERNTRNFILDRVKAFTSAEDQACAATVEKLAREEWSANIAKMTEMFTGLNAAQEAAGQQARQRAAETALPAQ